MTAEIVSVGTELLLGQITDTHAPTMARILAECGIACRYRVTVGDNLERLVETLRQALLRSDVVVTIGGLGPTSDDLTRDAIALALDDTLETVAEVEEKLRRLFASHGYTWVESNARQAQKPTCADMIPNPNGTAPGLVCRKAGKTVFALPGPKGEFDPMAYDQVKPMLETLGGGQVIHSRVLRIIGVGESEVEARIKHLMDAENPTVAPYAQTGEVHLRLTAKTSTKEIAEQLLEPVEMEIRQILGAAVYGVNLVNLESAVISLLTERGETLSSAESMTGGGLGERLTSMSGASRAYIGGVVTYTTATKAELLGIGAVVQQFGPVSSQTAIAMANAVRERLQTTYSVAITGNAGPKPDVDQKSVGLVYVAIATPFQTVVEEVKYRGIREDIRTRAEQYSLRRLREIILIQGQ
jgi:nicotinamide-nucleotide amidase